MKRVKSTFGGMEKEYGVVGKIYKVDRWITSYNFYTKSLKSDIQCIEYFKPATEEEYIKQQEEKYLNTVKFSYNEIMDLKHHWLLKQAPFINALSNWDLAFKKYIIDKYGSE